MLRNAADVNGMKRPVLIFSLLLGCALNSFPAASSLSPYESVAVMNPQNEIDRLIEQRLDLYKLEPARICSDGVFVRRAYLDVIGTLPTGAEARDFILSPNKNKRAVLIDRLLEREEFADYWAMKWCDVLRVKSEFPINLWPNGAQAYHHWIRTAIKENQPYDQFVREMLTSNGSNFRVPAVNFYRAMASKEPDIIAASVALSFMGARTEKWSSVARDNMAAFFSQVNFKPTREWKEEIVSRNYEAAYTNALAFAVFPDGTSRSLPPDLDPRVAFADWLTAPQNPWFTRNIVNRVWYWLLGRGLINEPDDIRPDNRPSHPRLLTHLSQELIRSRYNLKHLYRIILNSQTYQLSCICIAENREMAAENFAFYPLRRLEAEVLIDALNLISGSKDRYSSEIPEPFTFVPEDLRTINIYDGSISSPFLDMFGRPPRDTGLASERNNNYTASQRLHLLNSSHIQRKLESSPNFKNLASYRGEQPAEVVKAVYLMILSRFPTKEEETHVARYTLSRSMSLENTIDLAWALINTAEFLNRH